MSLPKVAVILAFFAAAKLWLRTASVDDLRPLLAPVSWGVEATLGGSGEWLSGQGYYHPTLRFVIDSTCAGANFLLITFLLLSYLLLRYRDRWAMLPLALLLAYPFTVLTNVSRITVLAAVGEAPQLIPPGLWHQSWGGFVYFSALLAAGLFFHHRFPAAALPSPRP